MTTRIAPGVGANLLGQHSAERNQDATAYVGNLDAQVTEELLWELFVQAGPVVNVYVPKDRVTNLHQGYGFVEFRSEEDADYAIKTLNMIKLYGKPIRVNKASQDKKSLDVGANLFVGNLDPDVDEKLLYDTFSAFGVIVTNPKIMRDPETGNSRGFGFISYDSFETSDAAIEAMNGQYLCNRQITVSYAYKKDTKGERHGTPAERVLAASNPGAQKNRPHTLFASGPPTLPNGPQANGAMGAAMPPRPFANGPVPPGQMPPLRPAPPPQGGSFPPPPMHMSAPPSWPGQPQQQGQSMAPPVMSSLPGQQFRPPVRPPPPNMPPPPQGMMLRPPPPPMGVGAPQPMWRPAPPPPQQLAGMPLPPPQMSNTFPFLPLFHFSSSNLDLSCPITKFQNSMTTPRPPHETWDGMLPGPPSRNNGGCADCSPSGLLAYGSGSSVVIVDTRSMQLVSAIPMPAPSPNSLAPFVTSVRWTPQPLCRDLLTYEPSNSHLRLAVGDRQGRIALLDFRAGHVVLWFDFEHPDRSSKLGVQDLCWGRSESWLLASLSGPSLLALWNASTGRCIWKYDASPEYFSCIRRDPFDSRHLCAVGLKGFLLSVKILGERGEDDVVIIEQQIPVGDYTAELQKLEKEAAAAPFSPALAVFPLFFVKLGFSPHWKNIIYVSFPKELVVFDLQYGAALSSTTPPRGCGKFMDVMPDLDNDLIYCAHLDGKLTAWKRKEGEQVHMLCTMEELMPSIGTTVPSPTVLAVVPCQSESALQNVSSNYSDVPHTSSPYAVNYATPDFSCEPLVVSEAYLISISDDGKIWNWLITAEGARDVKTTTSDLTMLADVGKVRIPDSHGESADTSVDGSALSVVEESEPVNRNGSCPSSSTFTKSEMSLKISLVGQLHLLSSTVTMLAVPSPSLTATLARGGNNPAVAVPLVALGTQSGTIDVIDVSANAVAASFSVHSSIIRGLRWLGNSRLVSFSYVQVNDKVGGYTNRLVVTCLRSGLNRTFRVLQKPERAPIRALRASSSGRYLLILFRDAPVEVWAMTKSPIMLRSLALPFTVLEWTLPTAPRPLQNGPSRQSSLFLKDNSSSVASAVTASPTKASSTDSKATSLEGSSDDTSESFAFALVNGALGVFEVHGRRIRDFRPKWPSSSFVSSDGLVTAMAYRLPHVVMGDRSGNIRWWDVTTGFSSSFNTHREGIRRIKFSPVVPGDRSRGRIAVLFYDNTFSIFDLDTQDPLANALLQPQSPGTLVLELDWLPLRTDKNEPLVLCIAGADSSFRLLEVNIGEPKSQLGSQPRAIKERFRPLPLCLPILFPTAHALSLRMILQLGVKPSWFNTCSTTTDRFPDHIRGNAPISAGDLRGYMIESSLPPVGDSVVPELLLKVLEPYRREGCILDSNRAELYATIVNKGSAARLAFAAAIFGESSEALFWLQLPQALYHLMDKSSNKTAQRASLSASIPELEGMSTPNRITSMRKSMSVKEKRDNRNYGGLKLMAFKQEELWESACERIPWHEKLEGEEAIQKRVHELVSVGNLEAAVTLLLSTPPEGSHFYPNALRAVALSSAVSRSLHELAVKVVAANMVRTDKSLSGIHLLSAVGRYQEACSQLQDAGCWTDAATLAATHLQGSDYARVLQRWADHVLRTEHNIWRALILFVAAGALHEALAALRDAQQADTAAMLLLTCHEINAEIVSKSRKPDELSRPVAGEKQPFVLPGINPDHEDVLAVGEYFGQYQRKLVHLCMDAAPLFD